MSSAAELAGRCASPELFTADGEPLPHDHCPMAVALSIRPIRGRAIARARRHAHPVHSLPYPSPRRVGQALARQHAGRYHHRKNRSHQRLLSPLSHRTNTCSCCTPCSPAGARRKAPARAALDDAAARFASMAAAQTVLPSTPSPRLARASESVCASAAPHRRPIRILAKPRRAILATIPGPMALILTS